MFSGRQTTDEIMRELDRSWDPFLDNDRLPSVGLEPDVAARFGIAVEDQICDSLYSHVRVVLPAGWRMQQSSCTYQYVLRDEHGRDRAHVAKERMFFTPRFGVVVGHPECLDPPVTGSIQRIRAAVSDGATDKLVFKTEWREVVPGNSGSLSATIPQLYAEAAAWLERHYPGHGEPGAYWEATEVEAPSAAQ